MKEQVIRWSIKAGLFGIGMLLALLALHGCGLIPANEPTLTVTISPAAGHPPFNIAIAAVCSEPDGAYTFTPPDGDPVSSPVGQFKAEVNTYPYKGAITWTDGERTVSESIRVGLVNKRPVAHDLNLVPSSPKLLQKEIIDLSYRAKGCENGNPQHYFGIEDPDYTQDGFSTDNDHFLYRVEVHDKDSGEQETVFDSDGRPLPAGEFRADPRFIWFPGWTKIYPPFPVGPLCSVNPSPTNPPGSGSIIKVVRVTVKEWGSNYAWEYEVEVYR